LAQEEDKKAQREAEKALRESKNITYEANENLIQNDFVNAEAEYRRAISKSPENIAAPYNLGRAYYNRESFSEAFGNFKKAGEKATSKAEKHKAYHNMGNVFMKGKEYEKAVEAYKEALRANPTDEETRYNLALAKELLKKQQDEQKNDQNKDDKNEDKKEDQNKDQDKEGDKGEKKPEENKEGEGDDKKEQKQKPNEGEKKEQKKKPRPNQLSKQQVQNLLEAMQNEEKKVQQKLDAKKVKGAKVKNEKDW
jgi:tetratricopeptide (TPR) repeat protein